MRNKLRIFNIIMAVLLVLLSLSSCSEESLEKISDFMAANSDYETTLTVEFDSEEDIEKFEKRLAAVSFDILSSEKNGNVIDYCLYSKYHMSDENWELLCDSTYEAAIVSEEHDMFLQCEDIAKLYFQSVYMNVYPGEEFFESYSERQILDAYLMIDDEVFRVSPRTLEEDGVKYLQYSYDKDVLVKFAVAYSSEPLEGDITVTETSFVWVQLRDQVNK